ncbi:MAG TPA: hypothetical protein VFN37_12145 [Candidatus Baltobacteraceae bacterium]|nr:hypothetical protein [Candidatus Baltobacteraceae bacterium]
MSAEWVTAVATVFTALVIGASAIAALMQLRHMRSGNQISAYNECRETMDRPEFSNALAFIRNELPQRLQDPAILAQLANYGFRDEYAGIRLVANLFESMGLFVRTGMMEERIACELWSGIILSVWFSLRPLTAAARAKSGAGVWVNFEYMALLAQRFLATLDNDGYPAGAERMPLVDLPGQK